MTWKLKVFFYFQKLKDVLKIWRFYEPVSGLDPDPDPDWTNFVDPDPDTINPDPHHWIEWCQGQIRQSEIFVFSILRIRYFVEKWMAKKHVKKIMKRKIVKTCFKNRYVVVCDGKQDFLSEKQGWCNILYVFTFCQFDCLSVALV